MNPELRQTLQNLTRNIESANETAQENIYTFSQNYVDPCFASIRSCFLSCADPCFSCGDRKRRKRGRSVGGPELSFDFYDDWDDEFEDVYSGEEARENDALLEPLVETSEDEDYRAHLPKGKKKHGRKRSSTNGSEDTTNSLSSRGDLIPSDEELEADAVPLDDEFAMVLERRNTNPINPDDRSSGKTGSGKRAGSSRRSITRSVSQKSVGSGKSTTRKGGGNEDIQEHEELVIASLGDLKQEERQIQKEEETQIERRREAAQILAQDRGLLPEMKEDGLSIQTPYQQQQQKDSSNSPNITIEPPTPITPTTENHQSILSPPPPPSHPPPTDSRKTFEMKEEEEEEDDDDDDSKQDADDNG
ncbi:hypothetical protein UCRPC4_g00501 [Phaeomoniella chlamydospora]|uniref:Uncharacterized protein n=1 Tax=Phaeomoniella chlamydospora TaxID=158046 RepID=A0A0G2HJQ1_PHACM|nr:hypothetical protein UCRPC4_g00501 [Phaeomoniella chlamydospora]